MMHAETVEEVANGMVHPITKETMTKYQKLINDPILHEVWEMAMCVEVVYLSQGFEYTKGTETMRFIDLDKIKQIQALGANPSSEALSEIINRRARTEKIAIKDVKLRTFIADDNSRDDLVEHVYDITYGVVKPTDNLVIIDDSIVRGTTLKKSIIRILDRLNPKKIVIVSSAPQIRYPDCYGIDMAKIGDFIAFKAALELLKDSDQYHIVTDVYKKCLKQRVKEDAGIENFVKEIYAPFTAEQISNKIAEMLKTSEIKAKVEVIFQTVEGLHQACPDHLGDWYFTGNYPTPGGNRVVNKAFMNFYEGKKERAY